MGSGGIGGGEEERERGEFDLVGFILSGLFWGRKRGNLTWSGLFFLFLIDYILKF